MSTAASMNMGRCFGEVLWWVRIWRTWEADGRISCRCKSVNFILQDSDRRDAWVLEEFAGVELHEIVLQLSQRKNVMWMRGKELMVGCRRLEKQGHQLVWETEAWKGMVILRNDTEKSVVVKWQDLSLVDFGIFSEAIKLEFLSDYLWYDFFLRSSRFQCEWFYSFSNMDK